MSWFASRCVRVGVVLIAFVIGAGTTVATPQHPDRLILPDSTLIPEGIAYDPVDDAFYIGSTYRRKIVKRNRQGTWTDFSTAADLLGVLGMKVDAQRRRLWAASANWNSEMPMARSEDTLEGTSALVVFNLADGKVLKHWRVGGTEKRFLNDLVLLPDGSALITDTNARRVYRANIESDSLTPIVQIDGYPNGIAISDDARTAYVAVWGQTNGIAAVDLTQRSVRMLVDHSSNKPDGIDGLYWYRGDLIGVQPFRADGKVARFVLNADRTAIVRSEVLAGPHEAFEQPTTGVVVNNDFWFIANSHLQTFLRATRTGTRAPLRALIIQKVSLSKN
jgi:sugar lactone lactonase YvrE